MVSESMRKFAAENSASSDSPRRGASPALSSSSDLYAASVARNRTSLADYPSPHSVAMAAAAAAVAGAGPGSLASSSLSQLNSSAAAKRSSYAGPATSRSEFTLSVSPNTVAKPVRSHQQHPQQQQQHPQDLLMMMDSAHSSWNSLTDRRDSVASSKGSLYGSEADAQQQQQQRTLSLSQDQVMTRIRKSFKEKEDFLKRPALPYWINSQIQQPAPIPREFYVQPKKFSQPLWPPGDGPAPPTGSPSSAVPAAAKTTAAGDLVQAKPALAVTLPHPASAAAAAAAAAADERRTVTSMEPWSMVFTSTKGAASSPAPNAPNSPTYHGLVPNTVPKPFVPPSYAGAAASSSGGAACRSNFSSSLPRIQENIASSSDSIATGERVDLHLKINGKTTTTTAAAAAPLATPEELTPSPTKMMTSRRQFDVVRSGAVSGNSCPALIDAEKLILPRVAQRSKLQPAADELNDSLRTTPPDAGRSGMATSHSQIQFVVQVINWNRFGFFDIVSFY